MGTALDDVRVEVAFSANPNTLTPAFVDLTSRAKMLPGISISRGRSEEFDDVQSGRCTLTLDNTDGALTAGLAGVISRTNLFWNPALTSNSSYWRADVGSGGTGALTRETTAPPTIDGTPVPAYARLTYATITTGAVASTGLTFGWPNDDSIRVVPGRVTTVSVYARCSIANRTAALLVSTHKADGSNQLVQPLGPVQTIGGGWVKLTATFIPEDGQVRAFVRVRCQGGSAWTVGSTMDATAALVEQTDTAGTYFDGDTPDGAKSYQWTGTAGASQATETTPTPFYPNVKPQNRLRVTYRDRTVPGNLLAAADASFEAGTVGAWAPGGSVLPALTSSTVRAFSGARSMLITWGAGGSFPLAQLQVPTVIGRTYTVSLYVWCPTGGAGAQLVIPDPFVFHTANLLDQWQRLSVTFVATQGTTSVQLWPNGAPTAGQQVWVDAVMVDEGSTLTPFTLTPAPIVYRFDGYVDEWPTAWPAGGDTEATVTITATDLQARLARRANLDSVIAETYKLSAPVWYFPLGESSDSTTAGDRMGSDSVLQAVIVGTGTGLGGAAPITFGDATGPGTDAAGAVKFLPANSGSGQFLAGDTQVGAFTLGKTLAANFLTSTLADQVITRWSDAWGSWIEVGTDSAGKAYAKFRNPWATTDNRTVTSATTFADGRTHHIAATLTNVGGSMTLTLTVDGIVRGTSAAWTSIAIFLPLFDRVRVGGDTYGELFTGTVSHVAGFPSALSTAALLEQRTASSTGFAGERSDQRIARIASWVGIPAGLLTLDVGKATIGHVDSNGKNAWAYLQEVTTTEAGVLFAGVSGQLVFYNRARSYETAATVDVTVSAALVDPETRLSSGLADIVNDVTVNRTGGATVRAFNQSSIDTYGALTGSVEVISATDADAFARAYWVLALKAAPQVKLPELGLDGLTDATTSPAVRTLEIFDRVSVTGMPAQASAAAYDLRVQGYTESISTSGWAVTANTTPFLLVRPLTLDDPSYGLLDGTNSLVY